jgi:hypothetical protein
MTVIDITEKPRAPPPPAQTPKTPKPPSSSPPRSLFPAPTKPPAVIPLSERGPPPPPKTPNNGRHADLEKIISGSSDEGFSPDGRRRVRHPRRGLGGARWRGTVAILLVLAFMYGEFEPRKHP